VNQSNPGQNGRSLASYRTRLSITMMLVVLALTILGLFLAERKVNVESRLDLLQDFRNELATVHGIREVRQSALAERCQILVERPRIHAALEDNAVDLLYPSARDELRDVLGGGPDTGKGNALKAKFYRFLDSRGAVIAPPDEALVGELPQSAEKQLALPGLTAQLQVGYLPRSDSPGVYEILAMPIRSTETGETIGALCLGFEAGESSHGRGGGEIKSGILVNHRLDLPGLTPATARTLESKLSGNLDRSSETGLNVQLGGAPYLLFCKQINPGSLYPAAYEVAIYPMANAQARLWRLRRHVIIAGVALLGLGLVASHFVSRRLSKPVEKLAVLSKEERAARERAQTALASKSAELQRSARFSADASHQLKTPVTVLRAGLEALLSRDDFTPEVYDEMSQLLHQTYRITGVIDDLLLLSRMDAGRLQIQLEPVNLSKLLEEWMDDISALPDDLHVHLKTNIEPNLMVLGEKSYIAVIVQNLLENARKYNVAGGEICVAAQERLGSIYLTVENTGRPIPLPAQAHIFERFHRGGVGENVPGHGLGLNLARELARLHGGDLRLVRSDAKWTEFEVRFRAIESANAPKSELAHNSNARHPSAHPA
jgi:signal transduction histidine kinase